MGRAFMIPLEVILRLDGDVQKALNTASFLARRPISSWIEAVGILSERSEQAEREARMPANRATLGQEPR